MKRHLTAKHMGMRIRSRVEVCGFTVPKAAAACDMSQSSFEEYLYGKSLPGALALVALSKGLRCPSDYLLFGETPA